MIVNKISVIILFPVMLLSFYIRCSHDRFNDLWLVMQNDYADIRKNEFYSKASEYTSTFYNDFVSNKVGALINSVPNKKLLLNSCITSIMVRSRVENTVAYEEAFLQYCVCPNIKKMVAGFNEDNKGLLDVSCWNDSWSSTTLGHLFYIAKVLESYGNKSHPELIIEFGGGFGNLAKCFKYILPKSTIVLLDLPEMCVIQKMFLNYTAPQINVALHESEVVLQKNAINLVPIYLLDKLIARPDLFISTFALSESPVNMQNYIINRNFFDAKKIYVVGQINGWKNCGMDWIVKHDLIMDAARKKYNQILCYPFHIFNERSLSYEILAS